MYNPLTSKQTIGCLEMNSLVKWNVNLYAFWIENMTMQIAFYFHTKQSVPILDTEGPEFKTLSLIHMLLDSG